MCQTNNDQSKSGEGCKSACKFAGTGHCAKARAARLEDVNGKVHPLNVLQQTDHAEPGCVFRGVDEKQGSEGVGPKY